MGLSDIREREIKARMVLIQILLITADPGEAVCVDLDPRGAPFWEVEGGAAFYCPI